MLQFNFVDLFCCQSILLLDFFHWFKISFRCGVTAFSQMLSFQVQQFSGFFFLYIDIPKVTRSNGITPIENTNYRLSCIIAAANHNPVTKYEWFENIMKIDYQSATFSFDSVKRDNSGNWFCKGIINQSNIIIEKNSNVTKVNVF